MSSYQDVNWSSFESEPPPVTNNPITLDTVIEVFQAFGYELDGNWPTQPLLNFVKTGEAPITISEPDFKPLKGNRRCYDRQMIVDLFDKVLAKNSVEGGVRLRAILDKQVEDVNQVRIDENVEK